MEPQTDELGNPNVELYQDLGWGMNSRTTLDLHPNSFIFDHFKAIK